MESSSLDPKGAAGSAKAQLHLIPLAALESCAGALALGRAKYGERNWANASPGSSTYISASLRHILAWQSGEDNDPESGLSHLGHAMAGLAIMLDAMKLGTLIDERVLKLPIAYIGPSVPITAMFFWTDQPIGTVFSTDSEKQRASCLDAVRNGYLEIVDGSHFRLIKH
jgi:hypothetical protein